MEINEFLYNLSVAMQAPPPQTKPVVTDKAGWTILYGVEHNHGRMPTGLYSQTRVGSEVGNIDAAKKVYEQEVMAVISCMNDIQQEFHLEQQISHLDSSSETGDTVSFVISEKSCYNKTSIVLSVGLISGVMSNWIKSYEMTGSGNQRGADGKFLQPCNRSHTRIPMTFDQSDYQRVWDEGILRE
jgi:hypothetical protein